MAKGVRIFALSDIHVDYEANTQWVAALSRAEYVEDVLILAGDVSHSIVHLARCLSQLAFRFKKLLFIPGNHDLWVVPQDSNFNSLDKFDQVRMIAEASGASMAPYHHRQLSIVPLLGWYDYSFGVPDVELEQCWMDFRACRWPALWTMADVTSYFLKMNNYKRENNEEIIISFSHFLPRIDILPQFGLGRFQYLQPVLGATRLERQVRQLRSAVHVYGHSHVNRQVLRDGTLYVNNAFGYPYEEHIAGKRLQCIYEFS
jgi:predicted phosphodiesterase